MSLIAADRPSFSGGDVLLEDECWWVSEALTGQCFEWVSVSLIAADRPSFSGGDVLLEERALVGF